MSFQDLPEGLPITCKRVANFQAADPGNGLAESHEIIALKLIGSSEVVDDLGDRSASLGMAHVVRELIVFDHRSIFYFCVSSVDTCLLDQHVLYSLVKLK